MTHRRVPASLEATVLEAVNLLSPAEIKAAIGRGVDTLYRAANPTNKMRLAFEDAAKLDAALAAKGLPRLFGELYRSLSGATGPNVPAVRLDADVMEIMAELGDIAGEVRAAYADETLSPEEAERIKPIAQRFLNLSRKLFDDTCAASGGTNLRAVEGGKG